MTSLNLSLRILRFSTDSCPNCKTQKRQLIVERFRDNIASTAKVIEYVCAAEQEEMKDEAKAAAYKLSEEYEVKAYPTVIVEAKLDGGASIEVCRFEGGNPLKAMEKEFETAKEELISRRVEW